MHDIRRWKWAFFGAGAFCFVMLGADAQADPGAPPQTFVGKPADSLIYIQVFKDPETIAAGLSHDHVVRAEGWSGSFSWNPKNAAGCVVSMKVPVDKLVVDEAGMRKKVGYDAPVKDSDRAKIKKAMLGAKQLDSAKFPTISFSSRKCTATPAGVRVAGMFKLHGKQKPVAIDMKLDRQGPRITATGTLKLKATDFGFQAFSALGGALKNQNEMKLTVRFVGDAK